MPEREERDFARDKRRGQAARRLLDDELFQEVVRTTRAEMYQEFHVSDTAEQREKIHATLRGMDRFLRGFEAIENAGTVAARELARGL